MFDFSSEENKNKDAQIKSSSGHTFPRRHRRKRKKNFRRFHSIFILLEVFGDQQHKIICFIPQNFQYQKKLDR